MENKITPRGRVCRPVAIKYTEGIVRGAQALVSGVGSVTLSYPIGGEKPYLCVDMGPASPGGYPTFEVSDMEGDAVLRTSYSDWYDYLCDPSYREKGDFSRGTCKYLGPELPVLPANPDRYEIYNICRTGKYIYPLLQGQQRFVLLTLENPGSSVTLKSYYINYTSSLAEYKGSFSSSFPELDYLWDASIYTLQIATIANSQSLESQEGRLLVRTLTKGSDGIVLKSGTDWTNYTLTLECETVIHPHADNSVRYMVRAKNRDNGYVIALFANGEVRFCIRRDGVTRELSRATLPFALIPNKIYKVQTCVEGDKISVCVEGATLCFFDATFTEGTVGFCQTTESWSLVHALSVTDADGHTLYRYAGEGLEDFEFTSAEEFVADGAKRDRLPWVGDLYWAYENVFCSFGEFLPAVNTIEMFRRHQCPNGFVWGTCYPENAGNPSHGDYGMYQSDIFSAWYAITVAYYAFFTNNREKMKEWYPSVKADAEYLIDYIDGSGLFYQRYETSKGLWDHCLGDYGYNSYNNLTVAVAIKSAAYIAEELGIQADNDRYERIASDLIDNAIKAFLDSKTGMFKNSLTDDGPCYLATAFALAFGLVPKDIAKRTVDSMCAIHENDFQMGKTVILFMKGAFLYGFYDQAFKVLTGSSGKLDYLGKCTLNWIDAVRDEKGPACTSECMPYSKERIANGSCWNDSSHPDTAVAFLMTSYILGIRPTATGYKTFRFAPQLCGLTEVEGVVPTPYGTIEAKLSIGEDGVLDATLCHPQELTPQVVLPVEHKHNARISVTTKR